MKTLIPGVVVLIAVATSVGGCASIIDGTSQEILVNTNPPAAACTLSREGQVIAQINSTPAAATIKKTKNDITISCDKNGYQTATYINHSGTAGSFWGNVIAGGVIGMGVDSASGADNKYESPVNISLVPGVTPQPQSPLPPSSAAPQTTAKPAVGS